MGRLNVLINNPDELIEELIEGMVSAHPDLITVEGRTGRAIVAINGPRDGKVGIVIGGGSGHEPAFAGYVGRGLADAAPLGNIFASPSPSQIMDAALAADGGQGVLFLYGNYTGDVMNFDMASEELADHGIEARSFLVTDDIASAPLERAGERRGIAGDFFVFKIAGAAADLGLSLDEVEMAARRANAATRTMGVAFSACVMPQTGKENFHIPDGQMEIGMGIHGEPGIERIETQTADAVAERLLSPIVKELELVAGDKVAVLVNGLGSTPLLELYLLHRHLAKTLDEAGLDIARSWVGNYCTSLNMGGASITLMKLDQELQTWLFHPCETPALRVGDSALRNPASHKTRSGRAEISRSRQSISRDTLVADGWLTSEIFVGMMAASANAIFAERDRLCELDGEIGDGDHGITMEIGWKAVLQALARDTPDATISLYCEEAAEAFLQSVGASAGPLYASAFRKAGGAVMDRLNLDPAALVAWLEGMAEGIAERGQASPGEKTMVDAWSPAINAAKQTLAEGGSLTECMIAASQGAALGAEATREMTSQKGRSRKLGKRSVGHVDPGAASAAIMIRAWAQFLETHRDERNQVFPLA